MNELREYLIHALWVADGGPGWTVANVSDAERCQAERREALYGRPVDTILGSLKVSEIDVGDFVLFAEKGWFIRPREQTNA